MTSNLKIIRLRELISFKMNGDLDFSKSKGKLQEIVNVNSAFANYNVLIDTRGAEVHLSLSQIFDIAKELAKIVHDGSPLGWVAKIAILCPFSDFEYAKFLELCSQNRGLNMQVFTDFEKMFSWISETSTLD
jgi:hypothetical protein